MFEERHGPLILACEQTGKAAAVSAEELERALFDILHEAHFEMASCCAGTHEPDPARQQINEALEEAIATLGVCTARKAN